ncbi:hypothetical protein QW131_09480 [Roseibium salinum]|nr:hypothetical protein [Roseibium salinum]
MMTDRDVEKAGFVTRWSRLKREASHDALSETEETSASVQVSSDDVEDEVMRANRQAAEAVDLDSLGFKSDFFGLHEDWRARSAAPQGLAQALDCGPRIGQS